MLVKVGTSLDMCNVNITISDNKLMFAEIISIDFKQLALAHVDCKPFLISFCIKLNR